MEQIPRTINSCGLKLCLRILFWDIRVKGFLSFFLFCFQSLCNSVSQNFNPWSTPKSYSNQSFKSTQGGVKLCKEEVILVMEKLGLNAGCDGDGIEEFGEQEIAQIVEEESSLAEVEGAFNVFDENKDGFIDANELKRVLCCLGLERGLMQCQKMIDGVDQNGDGKIDQDEFVKFMEQSYG